MTPLQAEIRRIVREIAAETIEHLDRRYRGENEELRYHGAYKRIEYLRRYVATYSCDDARDGVGAGFLLRFTFLDGDPANNLKKML